MEKYNSKDYLMVKVTFNNLIFALKALLGVAVVHLKNPLRPLS